MRGLSGTNRTSDGDEPTPAQLPNESQPASAVSLRYNAFCPDFTVESRLREGRRKVEARRDALVASSHLEYRRALVRILEDLKVNTFASATLAEAQELLSRQSIALVFCDDRLTDGSYRDLLQALRAWNKTPHVVVTTRTGEWKDYLEAVRLGAFDMIQYPYRPTDVELNVIRAMRGGDAKSDRAIA
jgi:CheY-like chemotaxis protein